MLTTCPLVGEGTDALPVLASAYCRPVDVVMNWRSGALFSGAALAIVERVARARNGVWRRMDRRDGFWVVVAMDSADDDFRLDCGVRATCHEKQQVGNRKRVASRVAIERAIIIQFL